LLLDSLLLLRQGDSRLDDSYLHARPLSGRSTDHCTALCGPCGHDAECALISFNMCLRGAGPKKAGGGKVPFVIVLWLKRSELPSYL
jgi:hypothetical protein